MKIIDYTALGRRIRNLRKRKGQTQGSLSEQIGISISFLGHVERGSRKASAETLVAIATALGTTPDALLRDSLPRIIKNDEMTESVKQMINMRFAHPFDSTMPIGNDHGIGALYGDLERLIEAMLIRAFNYGAQCARDGTLPDPLDE